MIPKVSKFYYYFYSENPHALVQLIAEANEYNNNPSMSESRLKIVQKHRLYCQLLNTVKFTIESYGYINFFAEYDDLVGELPSLCLLLKEFGHSDVVGDINQASKFYQKHLNQFGLLRNTSLKDDERNAISEKLDSNFDSYFDLSIPMKHLSRQIKNNPDDFCLDDKGKPFEKEFTGQLETYYANKNLQKRYSFHKGKVYGECFEFDFDGKKQSLYFYKNEYTKDLLKQWFKNGNLKYEKYSDDVYKYWYENGQIHIERNGEFFQKWDKNGKKIK
ncbi:toxin-antitoxin system YwqK family antitoxin [Chondrinema litorale]|uniref:toxin-antitoxin system YwqK family antitoxin n=1 Tax=Chondrinema litorale TaxID=2994555 RepID=UPI002542ED72|nr:hypothetical protein [Chondrinema litorale]UZR96370.1 hypothetical protein OQ292_22190 [Chondrinema litorale]